MINDSAGIEVPLIDKSETASAALGFRSAAVIEAARGLCETPVFIASEKEFVATFGAPAVDKYGMASVEAYLLAQRGVPQVVVRAKNPALEPSAQPFAAITFATDGTALEANDRLASNKIQKPADVNTACIYFKGEGDYGCGAASLPGSITPNKSNVVLRFSKPTEESAYANADRVMRVQVYDFAGASHIDNDQVGKMLFNPALSDIVDGAGDFSAALTSLLGIAGTATVAEYKVTAYVNGRPGVAESGDGSGEAVSSNLWDAIAEAIGAAKKRGSNEPMIPSAGWELATDATVTGNTDKYVRTLLNAQGKSLINAFNLSISLAISVSLSFTPDEDTEILSTYINVESGTVSVHTNGGSGPADVTAVLSTSAILSNASDYMYMGEGNADWAAYYAGYLQETFTFSFSYDDYDENYVSLQADAILKNSKYLVCMSNDIFGDYKINWGVEDPAVVDTFIKDLVYFQGRATPNTIDPASKSFAYSQALAILLTDNLTRWRCVCSPNLGDVMVKGDYVAAIESASESCLGLSNIGRAASTDVFGNLNGRHANRFIADFSVYGYRNLNGRRTAFTLACLVADRLNANFRNGNEARPPFGITYGQIACDEITQALTGPEREMLSHQYKVNPVMEDGGFFLWDECTSQLKKTSLSDTHNILSFIWMKFQIYDAMKAFIAEYNDPETVTRGLSVLEGLAKSFTTKKYCLEAKADAKTNVIGSDTMRFRFGVRFRSAARYIVVELTAYSPTQSLAISMAQEAEEM